jgi:hypothetical protein
VDLVIELAEVQARTEPIHHLVVDAFKASVDKWGEFVTDHPHLSHPFDATARANFIHPHLVYEVKQRFESVAGIEPTDAPQFFALRWLDGSILMRLKYVGAGGPHNVTTDQQRDLSYQRYTPELMLALTGDPLFPPPTLLSCGYTLDGIELGKIEIRCDCKQHLPWSFDIYGGTAVVEPLVLRGLTDKTKPALVTSKKIKRRPPLRVVTPEEE